MSTGPCYFPTMNCGRCPLIGGRVVGSEELAGMELTPKLIEAWKWELSVQVHKCRDGASDMSSKKADFLEGAYTMLTCLERAMSGRPSPSPLGKPTSANQ